MVERTITVVNPSGLHARPASQVVDFVKRYPGSVEVVRGERAGNLKSMLILLSMGLRKGTEITLRVDGEDEAAFLDRLVTFIQSLDE